MDPPTYEEAGLYPSAFGIEEFNTPPPPSYDASFSSPSTPPPTYGEAVGVTPPVVASQPQSTTSTSLSHLRDVPAEVRCPHCQNNVTTKVTYQPGRAAWCTCILLTSIGDMRRLLLLGVTAFCLCVLVAADTQSDRQGDKSFPEEDGVLQLKKGNFNRALKKYKQLLVHFFPRSSASIVTWLKRRAGSAADLIANLSQSEDSDELQVVGIFKDLNSEYVQVFYDAAIDLPDVKFVVTQNDESELIQAYKMMSQTSKEELIIFITVYQMDPVTEYSGQILFVLVNVDEPRNGRLMEYFRVRDFEAPLIRLVNLTDHVTYHLPSDTLDGATIKKFCQSYLDGKAKPKMQSEPIPEGWDKQPVKELVGTTLEKVAFNPDKTVFVLFYLPYSKKSQALFPLWEELAEAYKEQEDVVIARMDPSANDINLSMQEPYPSLCFFPALHAERMVVYTGKRKLKSLVKFIDKEMKKAKKDRVKEDEERRKYIEAAKAEDAKKANKTKDEL
eukprot:superscaffoldBa00001253_g9751